MGAVCYAASFFLLLLAGKATGFGQWYTVHIYPLAVGTLGRFSGFFPFSLVEMLLYFLILLFVLFFIRLLVRLFKKQDGSRAVLHFIAGLWLLTGILFLIYTLNCGINYRRMSFAKCEKITADEYTVSDLKKVCRCLTEDLNSYALKVERDDDGVMILGGHKKSLDDTGKKAVLAMKAAAMEFPELAGYYPLPKPLLVSEILSYQSLTGVYAPFTVEANYNQDMTPYNIPFTMCHELSHLRGFMQEEEANFIAYLACMASDQTAFRYSGTMIAWIKCMKVLRREDYESWKALREKLTKAVDADFAANNAFWERYEGTVSEMSEKVNDHYLKANGQADGVKSYDRMVDLLVAYECDRRSIGNVDSFSDRLTP